MREVQDTLILFKAADKETPLIPPDKELAACAHSPEREKV